MLNWGDPIPEPAVTSATVSLSPFDSYWSCSFSGTATCAPLGYVTESAWNEMAYDLSALDYFWGAGGGGTSTLFAKPYWQVGTTPSGAMRLLPDVSVSAAWQQVGYVISQSWTTADGKELTPEPEALSISGGTSAATPSFAGILALVNQALAIQNPTLPVGLGNANPVLYALNASTSGTAAPAFHDITAGDTMVPCAKGSLDCPATPPYEYGFAATAGYDLATGIGSVDVNNLVTAWTALTPTSTALTVTSPCTSEGATATLTATVSSLAGSPALTGSVVFYVETTDEGGVADLSIAATGALTATISGGHEGGTATASVVVPPGVLGQANVVAFYGGDPHYLASWSAPPKSVVAASALAVTPTAITVSPNEVQVFDLTGGAPPFQWILVRDSTCNAEYHCAEVEAFSATKGIYKAGPHDGATTIAAIDTEGAEVRAMIEVTGSPVDGGTFPPAWDGGLSDLEGGTDAAPCPGEDAGNDAGDAGKEASTPKDAQAEAASPDAGRDGSTPMDASIDSPPPVEIGDHGTTPPGCGCRLAGDPLEGEQRGAFAGLLLGLSFVVRRRNQGRSR